MKCAAQINLTTVYLLSRIVVYGDDMLQAVVPNSAKPFNFQKAYRLSEEQVCGCFHAVISQSLKWINMLILGPLKSLS